MGHFKDLVIQAMERSRVLCPACGSELEPGVRHSCRALSPQDAAYLAWLDENVGYTVGANRHVTMVLLDLESEAE